MAALDNLLQLFAQRDMRRAVAGQMASAPGTAPRASAPAPAASAGGGGRGPSFPVGRMPIAPGQPGGLESGVENALTPKSAGQAAIGAAGQALLGSTPGTESFANALGAARGAVAQFQEAERLQAIEDNRNEILSFYGGKDDIESLQRLAVGLTSLGDEQSLSMAQQLVGIIRTKGGDTPGQIRKGRPVGEDGSPVPGSVEQYYWTSPGQAPVATGIAVEEGGDPDKINAFMTSNNSYKQRLVQFESKHRILSDALNVGDQALSRNKIAQNVIFSAVISAAQASAGATPSSGLEYSIAGMTVPERVIREARSWLDKDNAADPRVVREALGYLSMAHKSLGGLMEDWHKRQELDADLAKIDRKYVAAPAYGPTAKYWSLDAGDEPVKPITDRVYTQPVPQGGTRRSNIPRRP